MKPYACSRGKGIKLFSNLDDIVAEVTKEPEKFSYVQQMIANKIRNKKVCVYYTLIHSADYLPTVLPGIQLQFAS